MTTATDARSGGVVPVIATHHRLMIARQHIDITQSELAERLGVTTSTVQRAESGQTKPRRTTLMAWSMATGVNLHWLETGESPRPVGPGEGLLLPHLDSNQKPAGLQLNRSDLHVLRNDRRLVAVPIGRWERRDARPAVIRITRAAAA